MLLATAIARAQVPLPAPRGSEPPASWALTVIAPSDPAYTDIGRLAAAGLLDRPLVGQRPLTRRELVRMLSLAIVRANASQARVSPSVRDALLSLDERFNRDRDSEAPMAAHLDWVDVTLTSADANARSVPADTGIGGVTALIAPLAFGGAQGRDLTGGTTAAIELRAGVRLGDHVAIDIQPRIPGSTGVSMADPQSPTLQEFALRLAFGNVVATAGRSPLAWGQGHDAGLFLSANAPPLDMISIGTDRATTPPSLLRYMGPTNFTIFVADLGARQYFRHTLLVGYKFSMAPSENLEAGVTVLNFQGGEGAPDGSALRRIADVFFFPAIPLKGSQFSNKMAGIELRYRLRRWGGLQLYWELNMDDFDVRRFSSMIWDDDSAQLFGITAPLLGDDGRWSLTAEYHHTGTRFGRHQQFLSGATLDQRMLGEPLGPDADGGYLWLDWAAQRGTTIGLALAAEAYRGDQYVISSYEPFVINRFASTPGEHRWRAVASVAHRPAKSSFGVHARAGVEAVTDFAFVRGASRTGGLVEAGVTYAFR